MSLKKNVKKTNVLTLLDLQSKTGILGNSVDSDEMAHNDFILSGLNRIYTVYHSVSEFCLT